MKKSFQIRSISVKIIICLFSLVFFSCAPDVCPTYMKASERAKSIRGQEINGSWEQKNIPSPRIEKNKSKSS
ncbi:MAG TPA: hypothetical protein VK213_01540 [Bacteroidales bacterium]|nr:hypothetical protein [Bacteroidales bacterium]